MRMESRKRMDYGFQGYQAPPLPRAMRSARGRGGGLKKKNWEENGMAVFEMLATVAEDVLEAEKCEPGIEVIKSSDHCMEVGNNLSEQESSAEQALLELDKSRSLAHGDGAQWPQGFPCKSGKIEPDDQGSSDEKAVVSGAPNRKLLSEEVPLQGDYPDNTIQTASRSISSISELDCHGQSHLENEKDPDTCLNALAAIEKPMVGSSPGEGEDKHGCWTDKERYSTNACKGNFLTEQSLLSSEQNLPLSVVELTKETMGFVENGEGKGENEIEESNLGHWKRRPHGNVNMVDELMHDSHSLPASSAVSEEAPMFADTKPPPLISSGSSEDLPLCGGSKPCDSFCNSPNKRVNVCRDDDDNSSGCTTPSRIIKKSHKNSYLRAARRSITSKLRKAASASSRKRKHSDIVTHTERIVKMESPDCGEGYTRRRTVRCSPVKRNRLAKETFFPASDFHTSTTSATFLDNNCVGGEPPVSIAKIRRAKSSSVASSPTSAAGSSKHSSNKSGEPHVKLSIKSFTIPELFIDMPESATVASLKRAVMEAAMNLLGDELRVCVLLQGKKLCDEGDTLYQLGISHGGKLDSVGFMLEPNPMPTSQACAEDPLFVLSRAAAQPSARYQTVSASVQASAAEGNKGPTKVRSNKLNGTTAEVGVTAAGKIQTDTTQWAKSEYETTDSAIQNGSNPGALIVHPSIGAENVQGLALVPLNHKSQDVGKRRIRRPFTVAEVEALVQAVETLGTGRWRDVKLRAFEHAKHRTYVDLKDKWKTLVHTAKIAPHQRRGEPVPQELLDRVIQAHNYWTDQQAKQQAELCL